MGIVESLMPLVPFRNRMPLSYDVAPSVVSIMVVVVVVFGRLVGEQKAQWLEI